jgi:pimeloyl-ACP methyl ester carboxylesterase
MEPSPGPYPSAWLPEGVRSRFIDDVNGLKMHVLEAGEPSNAAILLLHGFPELAYSWRKVMAPLAAAGYYVVAPDQRGYGRTTGADTSYDGDLYSYRRLNAVRDVMGLVSALGRSSVTAVVGHDFGSPVAAWCGVTRPDIFRSVVLMSAPFAGTASFPFAQRAGDARNGPSLDDALAALDPPRRHYQRYYQTREANENMWHAPQGISDFIRGYYHYKSADWKENQPHPLEGPVATAMAQMPTYYIMERGKGMAETVAEVMPAPAEVAGNRWLPDDELKVYAEEYGRNGFQGGLQWYRAGALGAVEMEIYAGRQIEQPSMFIAGTSDWGTYQSPGAVERMQKQACSNMQGVHLVPGAGHWVQQEQPEATVELLLAFLERNAA